MSPQHILKEIQYKNEIFQTDIKMMSLYSPPEFRPELGLAPELQTICNNDNFIFI